MSEAMLRLYATATAFVQDRYKGRKDRGATAVEYGLLVGLIAVAIIVGVGFLGSSLSDFFHGLPAQLGFGGGTAPAGN